MTSKPWPPPPDLASVKELVATADVEGFLAKGGHADEYDLEAEQIANKLVTWPTASLTADHILPVLERVWADAFSLSGDTLAARKPKLQELADQIARFFGPEATPQVRGQN
jgi:hypothetical protein